MRKSKSVQMSWEDYTNLPYGLEIVVDVIKESSNSYTLLGVLEDFRYATITNVPEDIGNTYFKPDDLPF